VVRDFLKRSLRADFHHEFGLDTFGEWVEFPGYGVGIFSIRVIDFAISASVTTMVAISELTSLLLLASQLG